MAARIAVGGVVLTLTGLAILICHAQHATDLNGFQSGVNNVDAVRNHGHPVPPSQDWWIKRPVSEEVVSSLIAPESSQDSICIKRLWIPRDITPASFDKDLVSLLESSPRGPHHLALLSHYHGALGNEDEARDLMELAKTRFFEEPWKGFVFCGFRTKRMLSAVLSLDWIRWENTAEFERAFQRAKFLLENDSAVPAPRNCLFHSEEVGGYWVNDSNIEHANMVEELLVLCVCGVNKAGPSHHWASSRLKHLGQSPIDDPEALYSTFEFANVLSLLSRRGGGREFGQAGGNPGYGGYEAYFAASAMIQLEAVDTATGRRWNLVDKSLYIHTRPLGLVVENHDSVVSNKLQPDNAAILMVLAKLCARSKPANAGLYQWAIATINRVPAFLEFQLMAGYSPQPKEPPQQSLAQRIGSRWHYRDDVSQPDSTMRLWVTNRDIDNFRVSPDERCMYFAVGNVGLVDGHANRCEVTGALANGVHLSKRTKDGGPFIGKPDFWAISATHHPYWSPKRAVNAEQVLKDPFYLVGTDGPVEVDGVWRWERDYTSAMTRTNESEIAGKVSLAKMSFSFDPKLRRLQIVDTIRAHHDVYVGWHFSPTHHVDLQDQGFQFGDGKDEIRVKVEGLDGTKLGKPKRRQEWVHDGYTLPLEWHEQIGGDKRIAENIAYLPATQKREYRVRVTIQANP